MSQQPPQQQQQMEVMQQYEALLEDQRAVMAKLADVESDRHEHSLVLDTLKPMAADRKCHRLVGGVLMERTVGDVRPMLEAEIENIDKLISVIHEHLKPKEEAIKTFVEKNREALGAARQGGGAKQQQQQQSTEKGAAGVLA
eukprot:PhM_4_TR6001/c0_g1_i1/m.89261/K09549/PFDN2; prefoldin subunit 2